MKNKVLIVSGVVMVLLAIVSVVSFILKKPSETSSTPETATTLGAEAEINTYTVRRTERPATEYNWESVVEPTISENYIIVTAAGGNGAWQVSEEDTGFQSGYEPNLYEEIVIE